MSEGIDGGPAARVVTLLRSALLMACLSAILAGAYGLVLPTGWPGRPLWVLIASAGGLALLLSGTSRRAGPGGRTADDVALMFGVASAILGIGAVTLIGFGLVLRITEERTSTQTLIYRMTHPWVLAAFLACAVPVALSGGLGLWIARGRDRKVGRISLAGSAVRFSAIGLGIAGMIAVAVAAAAIYRWLLWG